MKIAIDISQIPYQTGVSVYTQNLVENLLKIDKKNEYLLFATSLRRVSYLKKFQKKFLETKNVTFKILPFPISFFEVIFNKLRIIPVEKLIGEVDLLHSSDWIEPKVSSPSTKKVTTVHDMVPYLFPATLPKRVLKNQKKRLAIVKNESDIIICVSNTTKEDVEKFLEVPSEKIKVIYSAAAESFKPQNEQRIGEVLQKYKIKPPFILSVGTQEPRKNIPKLVDAFQKINRENPSASLVLTGKYGWGATIDPVPNMIQTGFISENDLISLYSACRVFVYPSLYEGFGLPVLEAMACGAPVITSNNSSLLEIAKDAAILVDPRSEGQLINSINMVLNLDEENYQKMVKASLERAKTFSWEKTAKETLEVYKELLNQK